MFKYFGTGIKTPSLIVVSEQPQKAVPVFVHIVHPVVCQVNAVIKLCLISPEIIPIEFIDAIPSGKPHISLSVLQNIHDSILRKSLFGRIMGKDTLRLCSGR